MTEYILTAAVFTFAGLLQGVSGFGCLLVAMPLLTLYLPPQVSVPLATICGTFINMVVGASLFRNLDKRKILPILAGSLPGMIVGTMFLTSVDPGQFRLLLGLLLIGYSLFTLLARPRPRKLHWSVGTLSGVVSGAIAAAFSAGGPPVIVYTAIQDWNPDQKRATLAGFFSSAWLMVAVTHAATGLTSSRVLALAAASTPCIFLGIRAGLHISRRLSPAVYGKFVQLLLLVMGLVLILG
jgi:hypothetical protein